MRDKFFLDTNILVYTFDKSNSAKKEIARELLKQAHSKNGCISFQVIQEFLNVATKKFEVPIKSNDAQNFLSKILYPICEIFPSENLYLSTLEIKERWKFSFYDSLIIASALEAKCKILYTEDLHHNQKIYEMNVVNPFL